MSDTGMKVSTDNNNNKNVGLLGSLKCFHFSKENNEDFARSGKTIEDIFYIKMFLCFLKVCLTHRYIAICFSLN